MRLPRTYASPPVQPPPMDLVGTTRSRRQALQRDESLLLRSPSTALLLCLALGRGSRTGYWRGGAGRRKGAVGRGEVPTWCGARGRIRGAGPGPWGAERAESRGATRGSTEVGDPKRGRGDGPRGARGRESRRRRAEGAPRGAGASGRSEVSRIGSRRRRDPEPWKGRGFGRRGRLRGQDEWVCGSRFMRVCRENF